MADRFRQWSPEQSFLFPPSPRDWLREDHLVYFLLEIIEQLDLSAIEDFYLSKDARGQRPYDPRMMTALLLYGYCVGIASSRKLERATYEDVAFRVLTAGENPDHTVISEYRRIHLEALKALFLQVLRICQEAGLVKLGHVSLDGTKVKANASKHKAMSYDRMLKKEEQLKKEIAELLQRAEQADGDEDAKYGSGRRGDELPEELRRREDRLERIQAARKKLEAEAAAAKARERRKELAQAQEQAKQASDEEQAGADKRSERARRKSEVAAAKAESTAQEASMPAPDVEPRSDDEMPSHQVRADKDGTAKDKAQRNFTDPDSRIQKTGDGYIQGYNAQAVVDAEHQVIVAEDLSNQPPDNEYFIPLLKQVEENCGEQAAKCSADNGYWSERNDRWCEDQGIDRYIATGRLKHDEKPPPARGPIPKNLDRKGRMRRKLRTQKGREIYKMRKAIVEPVFGQMKGARGLRTFMLRGTDKVRAQWSLWCTTHNILKLFRASVTTA